MKAIVLTAGYATRLYPLTLDKPKALLPIKEKPILNYIIEKIDEIEEVDEIFIISNDKFYLNFVWWLQQNEKNFNKKIEIINDGTASNETRLGGIGDIYFTIKEKNIQDDILVIAGDNLFDFSLKEMVDFFNKSKKTILGVYELENKEEAKKFGVVELQDNKIVGFEEKPENPKTNLIAMAVYIYPKEDLEKIKEYMETDKPKDGPGFLIQDFCKNQDVYAFIFQGRWFDIGSKEDYEKVQEEW